MFCLCCAPSPSGFAAEGLAEPVIDIARAMKRRAAYDRRAAYSQAIPRHPPQIEFVIRNVRAVTMDPHIGNPSGIDIHVRDGIIANLGRNAGGPVPEIDGTGLTAFPGFIAAHRHLVFERLAMPSPAVAGVNDVDAGDLYRALRLIQLDLLSAGFTCLHHCARDLGGHHAETAILAQIDAGLRGRFSYPVSGDIVAQQADLDRILRDLQSTWFIDQDVHLLELGVTGDATLVAQLAERRMLPATTHHEDALPCEDQLASRTMEAARRLELDPWIGSLSPGKRADLILFRGVEGDPDSDITPDRIELVCVDGRIRKRNGILTEPDEGLIRHEGSESIARLLAVVGRPADQPPVHSGIAGR